MTNEIKHMIISFLNKYENGKVTLLYPQEVELIREGIKGTEITKESFNRIKFCEKGICIRQALGYSLITNKHLFLPYGSFSIVFEEEVYRSV